jgi:hypothetical protein
VNPNEILHSDFWGPTKHASREGFRYFMTVYDDYTRRIQLYCLKDKKGAVSAFKQYFHLVETQCDTKVKLVRSDNGGEFTSDVFLRLLEPRASFPTESLRTLMCRMVGWSGCTAQFSTPYVPS